MSAKKCNGFMLCVPRYKCSFFDFLKSRRDFVFFHNSHSQFTSSSWHCELERAGNSFSNFLGIFSFPFASFYTFQLKYLHRYIAL